jgi:hypothetical protein
VTIVALQANSILVTLGGIVASFGTTTRFSAPADAVSQTSIAFTPTDAAGNAIITDPYATPISVTLTEVLPYPFDPHVALLVNGQNVGMTATLNSPADTLAVAYDGGGGPPYWATIALTSGSASQTLTFNPYYLTSSDAYFEVGPNPIFHFTASGQFATATYAENGYAFTDAFTNAAECAGIATVSPFANNALAITTTATSGNCTVYVFDGNVTRMLSISIVAPAPSPSPSPSPSPVPSATP